MGKRNKKPAKNPWAQAAAFARAKKLTPERRREIAREAGLASGRARIAAREAEQEPEPVSA